MTYLRVRWRHDHAAEPILLVSELDDERYETRKVEVFGSGDRGQDPPGSALALG